MSRLLRFSVAAVALAFVHGCATAPTPPPTASEAALASPLPVGPAPELSEGAIQEHLEALAQIGEEHDGVRTAGTPGYTASVDYVIAELRALGYTVTTPVVEMTVYRELPGSTIEIEGGETFSGGPDFHAMIYSGGGDLTAPVATVGFEDSPGGEGARGCDASDFDEFPAGAIALTAPGAECFRRQVVQNAQAAGAVALVGASPSWAEGQARRPTLLFPDIQIPALAAIGPVGDALQEAANSGADVHIRVEVELEPAFVHSVVAETPGDPERVVMMGAHLDSVHDGPGINDDGSGVAALLEIARVVAGGVDGGRIRFGFWAAEEYGTYGSRDYVAGLSDADRTALRAYLNLDMVGSINGVPFVYDGRFAPSGSDAIADYLVAALEAAGVGAELRDLGGASDHAGFAEAGIAVGGIFSGATELKSDAEATAFGGDAGEPMDPCYHLACDTVANVDVAQVATFGQAAAVAALALARGELMP
jgi:Zn-dependent M28 family amino/carboxypeptidase